MRWEKLRERIDFDLIVTIAWNEYENCPLPSLYMTTAASSDRLWFPELRGKFLRRIITEIVHLL